MAYSSAACTFRSVDALTSCRTRLMPAVCPSLRFGRLPHRSERCVLIHSVDRRPMSTSVPVGAAFPGSPQTSWVPDSTNEPLNAVALDPKVPHPMPPVAASAAVTADVSPTITATTTTPAVAAVSRARWRRATRRSVCVRDGRVRGRARTAARSIRAVLHLLNVNPSLGMFWTR
jgi:hypothetical protein